MSKIDMEYYQRRERQERESAERSDDHSARRVHLEMANRYSALLQELSIKVLIPPVSSAS
jgi:hypothetical protein